MSKFYKATSVEDTEMIYSLLRQKYPDKQVNIEYNDNTKEYKLILTNEEYIKDPNVPLNVSIKVIYGDSVTGDSALLLRDPISKLIYIETIQSIFDKNKKVEYVGFKMFDKSVRLEKEYSTTDYQIWTDQGWSNIKKVIRHKCDKKIYKVLSHTGCVKVTEDHSLLDENLNIITPKECIIGTKLLQSYPDSNEFNSSITSISKDRAFIYGFFYGNGDIEIEKWKIIKEYPEYSASTFGNIKNNKSNKILKVQNNGSYLVISLKKDFNSYTKRIHRLIAETFLDNPENKSTVNHKNHNIKDNRLENLEWFTMSEQNIHKNTNMKNTNMKSVNQYDLNMNYINTFNSVNEAMRITQIPASSIIYNCNGYSQNCNNFIWKYNEYIQLENEIWKNIEINNINFTISNKGRVKSKKGIISYGSKENTGYYRVKSVITKNNIKKSERISVHILVAKAFIINNDISKNVVNHIDGNKENNCVENLEWVSQKENMIHYHNNIKDKNKDKKLDQDQENFINENIIFNNADMKVLKNLKTLLKKEYPNNTPVIYDIIESSGVYKLTMNNPKFLIDEYRQKFYDSDRYKKVPTEILNSNNEIIQSFFDGYFEADGCRKDKETIGCTRFDNKGQIGSAGLYYLMKRLGYNVSLNTRTDKEKMFRISVTKMKQRKIANKIKKIELISEKIDNYVYVYVYDLETECGRFQAGVGNIIVKNTDSIFAEIKFNRDDFKKNREDTFKLASLCGDIISDNVFKRPPIFLEFEKVFQPFILLTKKRYIGKKYEDTRDPFKLKAIIKSGIAVTRRDYCKMVKKCYTQVIDCIVDENNDSIDNISQSIEIYKRYVDRIDNYQIDFDDLIVSAMLAKSYKTRPVHVQLAEKLKTRKEEVEIGSRIQYMYIENTSKEIKKKSELGEDPIYAKKNGLKYNRGCYLTQLAKPLISFFKVILVNHKELLEDLIESTNIKLIEYGEPKLKPSDYILPIGEDIEE